MKVYYSKGWAITFVISGTVLLVLNLILINLTHNVEPSRMIPIVIMLIVGTLYFFQPYFELQEKSLLTFSLFGFVGKRYAFNDISQLTFQDSKLFLTKGEKIKRIRVSRLISNKRQWESFVALIERSEPGNELHE